MSVCGTRPGSSLLCLHACMQPPVPPVPSHECMQHEAWGKVWGASLPCKAQWICPVHTGCLGLGVGIDCTVQWVCRHAWHEQYEPCPARWVCLAQHKGYAMPSKM
eukprot:scaffold246497_cov23-Tisochrysis_lutea.AAC.1